MKQIQPVSIWKNGQNKTASVLDAYIINDNLESSCTFYWMLKEANVTPEPTEETPVTQIITGQVLADGNTTMSGEDYDNWDGNNDLAFEYIAEQINVTII
jgi:hypothetical protein